MDINQQKINELTKKLEELSNRQNLFSNEIKNLHSEIQLLKSGKPALKPEENAQVSVLKLEPVVEVFEPIVQPHVTKPIAPKQPKKASDLEKIIGESWLNKIGVLGIIIGVAILGKYSIENNLISPLTRIILGYISGIVLLGLGFKLKAKFESYSAVLVSGAMAIFYFITYFAYSFYQLFPQIVAFVMMVVFTIFAVIAALNYNRSIIAHIGLVGAYAVPFLLSNDSGRTEILFTYIAIINLGILVLSIKKYWKSLYYVAFSLTWLIFAVWFWDSYYEQDHKVLALVFATLFFLMFYVVAVTNRIMQEQRLAKRDIILLLLNSFIYFGFGYGILNSGITENYLGLFTLFNAIIHFVVGYVIRNKKLADTTLFYLVLGLVFVFITIAIPIQLDGNWVTLIWIAQAVLLFWIGRTKKVIIYEKISYAVMILAFFSLLHDWGSYSHTESIAFFNVEFLTSLFAAIGYGFMTYLMYKKNYFTTENQNGLTNVMKVFAPILLVMVSYFTFSNEITLYFENWFQNSAIRSGNKDDYSDYYNTHYNYSIQTLKSVFLIAYTILFFGMLSLFNNLKTRNKVLGIIAIIFTLLSIFISQTIGLYFLGELRDAFVERTSNAFHSIGFSYILVRYALYSFVAFGIYTLFVNAKQVFMNPMNNILRFLSEFVFYSVILCFLSNELITWLDLIGNKGVFKLGLSILWGIYALFLISLGIYKQKKYLRIGAIILFAITILKLFFYDISHLNTISKTIVFISLGVLLLIISFLYNKFKDKISGDEKIN